MKIIVSYIYIFKSMGLFKDVATEKIALEKKNRFVGR